MFRRDEIHLIYAQHLPNKIYEITFELNDSRKSHFIVGRGDESCLNILDTEGLLRVY